MDVQLYIYDLSGGLARFMSPALLGRQIDGIYHTAIVVHGQELFYGSHGIQSCRPGTTLLGEPQKKVVLGQTHIDLSILNAYLQGLSDANYSGKEYNLLNHNCNNFTDDLAHFLCGNGIPKYILDLPGEVLQTPLGQSLRRTIESLEQSLDPLANQRAGTGTGTSTSTGTSSTAGGAREASPDFVQLNNQIEEARSDKKKK